MKYTRATVISATLALFNREVAGIDYPGRKEYLQGQTPHWGDETRNWLTSAIVPAMWDYLAPTEREYIREKVRAAIGRRRSDHELDEDRWSQYCDIWRPLLDLPLE